MITAEIETVVVLEAKSPYIPNEGPGAPHLRSPLQDAPRLFDMLIVAVGRFELAREQKLSEG